MNKKIALKLLGEFWLPFAMAGIWTAYNFYPWTKEVVVKDVIKIFGPSFFLSSWILGQFFRVKKQVNVDQIFTGIENRLNVVAGRLEAHTKDFMGYTTGGDSYVWMFPGFWGGVNQLELRMNNDSTYPAFDIRCEIIDLHEPIDPDSGRFWTRLRYNYDKLYPNHMMMNGCLLDVAGKNEIAYNIFIYTRSGSSMQQVRAVRAPSGGWSIAYRVSVGEGVVKLQVPENFPGWDSNNPNALFN